MNRSPREWQCVKCGEWWPTWGVVEAFRKRKRAAAIHPGEECKK